MFGSAKPVARTSPGAAASLVATADLNCDGLEDVIVSRVVMFTETTWPITIFVNDGHGGFSDETSQLFEGDVPRTQAARRIIVADLNGDHCDDVYIADTGKDGDPYPGYPNTLILSAPGGRLIDASANMPREFGYTHAAAVADVNGDGAIDIYEGSIAGTAPPRILLNDGSGHFHVGSGLLPGNLFGVDAVDSTGGSWFSGYSSLFVDADGDGHPDLVLGGGDHTTASLLLHNTGDGHFVVMPGALPSKPFGTDAIANGVSTTDINGDGHPDLILAYTKGTPFYKGSWLQVLINDGHGRFSDQTASYLPQSDNNDPWVDAVEFSDLNHDGRLDIATHFIAGFPIGSNAPIYLNTGNGGFLRVPDQPFRQDLYALVPERDGRLDLFTVDPAYGAAFSGYGSTLETDYVQRELRAPPAVTGATASGNRRDGVQLSWRPADQASRYEIWRTIATRRQRIATITSIHYLDRTARRGVVYRYSIRPINAAGLGPFASAGTGSRR